MEYSKVNPKSSKVVGATEKKLPPNAGKGRKAGTPNKTTGALKDAILKAGAMSGADSKGKGGLIGYLKRVADDDVKAFAGLLGKVLPMTVVGDKDAPLRFELVAPWLNKSIADRNGDK